MKNIIAAGDKTTVDAAEEIFWVGGNAFDAAVGAMFVAMVAEPALTSAGGGGHFLAIPENSRPVLFDFFADVPGGRIQESQLDFFNVFVDFGTTQQEFYIGKGAVAVPGAVAGLLHVQKELGVISRRDVLSPAIRAAKEGVVLSDMQAYLLTILEPILTYEKNGQKQYAPEGSLLKGGDRLVMPEFSGFLDALAHEGPDLVYKGDVAKIIVEWGENGGLLTAEDLSNYQVKERIPLTTRFCDYTVILNPPPASSGILIDVSLLLLEKAGYVREKSIALKDLLAVFDMTNRIRRNHLPDGTALSIRQPLTQQPFFSSYVNDLHRGTQSGEDNLDPPSRGATTHISILDKNGNAASVTTTNGEGCGYLLPEAGFMLNNMLGEEDLNPQGFHLYPAGTRLPSMIAPTIVLSKSLSRSFGSPVLLTGSAGSNRIRSVIVQMIVNILCNGLDIQEATDAPRVHLEGDVLHAEPGIPEEDLVSLEKRHDVQRWDRLNVFFGGANSVMPDRGAGDPRRGGLSRSFSD